MKEYLKKIKLTEAAAEVEISKAANLYPIYFDSDKSKIRKDSARELNKVMRVINRQPNIKIEYNSPTDSRARDRHNLNFMPKKSQLKSKLPYY